MNKVFLLGRLTKEPEVKYVQSGQEQIAIAQYNLAVNRKQIKGTEQQADFIVCKCFRGNAEFAEKYLHKGTKISIIGHIQTGSYTNKEGKKVFTTEVIVEEQEFAESKKEPVTDENGFMNLSDDVNDPELPFN